MKIVVTIPVSERDKTCFQRLAPQAEFAFIEKKDLTQEQIEQAEILLGNVPTHLLQGAKHLKWIQLNSAGVESYTKPGVLREGVLLTNASGAYGLAISEHMLAMVLCKIKRLPEYLENQNQGVWKQAGTVSSIQSSKTLIVGMGDIGGEFAKRMHALGSHVCGIRRRIPAEKPEYLEGVYPMDALDHLLPEMDIVAICLPGTQKTRHLFDENRLYKMKKGSLLINVGRGNIIDTMALCKALQSGHLSGACLDVVDPEPLPQDHPLWHAPGVLITPHIAGGYHLQATLEKILDICKENLQAYLAGKPLKNLVDLQTGDRTYGQNAERTQKG